MAKDFCILHMSDAHFGIRDDHGQQTAVAKAQIQAAHKAGLVPDLCVFSGDIAQSSEPEQLAQGEAFLKSLLEPWPKAALVVVPGNHDIARRHTDGPYFRAIAASSDVYHGWKLTSGAKLSQFDAFFGWHQQAKGQVPLISEWSAGKPYAFRRSFNWDGMPIHVVGVNSSLFCCDNMDEGQLVIDVKSLRDELNTASDVGGLVLAISHHPLSNLVAWNREIVQQNLRQAQGAHVLLHGHLHKHEGSEEANTTGQQLAILGAGASFQGKVVTGNAFAFYTVCFDDIAIKSHVLEYSGDSGQWHYDGSRSNDIYLGIPRPSPALAALRESFQRWAFAAQAKQGQAGKGEIRSQ
ncbi:hypothetical protein AJ87_14910 [Rhizobium yanglingense]|nr:hypothetical protein AJ87_14910 [Rhizobium yanglingense]